MSVPILIGLALRDDDAAPLALGRAVARWTGAPLALVSAYVHEPGLPRPVPELDALMVNGTLAALEECAEPLREEHEVTVHARRGSPIHVLHELTDRLGAGLIVVGSSHRGRLGRVLAGSVTSGVLHGAPCAVAVAPRGYAGDAWLDRIAVAYDASDESRDALAAAVALAALTDAGVHLLTVAGARERDSRSARERDSRSAREIVQAGRDLVAPEFLDDAEMLEGEVGDLLVERSHEFDLLVCGSRGYGAVRSVALGAVSRALVKAAACPVLVIPPAPGQYCLAILAGRGQPVAQI